jgi:Flp pilus assembly protein TadD
VGKERLEKLQTAAATSAAAEVHKKKQQQQKAEIKPSSSTSASTSSSSSSSAAKTADPAAAVAPPPSIVKTQDRTPSDACKVKGNEAMVQGNFSQAFSHYTDALSLQPSNVAARNNRCMCALKQGKWLEADSDASAVLALEPNNSKALFRRAHAREGLGLLEEARLDLRQALTCEPGNAKTQEALKGVEVKLSEEAKSRKELQRTQTEELERLAAQAEVEAAEEARELKQKLLRAEGKAEAAKAKAKAKVAAEQAEKEAREEQEEQEKSSNGGEGGGEDADDAEARFLASLAGAAPADDEEDGEEEEGAMKNQGTRIMIEDEEESEDDDDEDVEDEDEENAEKGGSGVNNGGSNEDDDDDEEDDAAVYAQLNAQSSDDAKAQGNAFMAKGLFEKAAQLYTLALARDPANLAARNNRAASYLKLSNFERCAEDCSAVLTKEPENKKALARRAEALVGQSRQHSKNGNSSSSRSNSESKSFLERALEDLAVLERLEPGNPSTAARLEEIQTALAALTPPPPSSSSPASPPSSSSPSPPSSSPSPSPSSSSLLPMDAAATSAKAPKTIGGTVVTIVDEDEDSEDDTEVSVSPPLPPPPSPAAALSPPATAVDGAGGGGGGVREASDEAKALGNACLGQGDLSGAEAHYSKALGLDSTNSAARNNRSLCRLKRRDYAGAEKDATGVILTARSTDSAISAEAAALGVTKALLRRAQAREALGDLEMACKDLETVLESDPSHKEATTKLKAYEAKKRMQQQKKKTSSSSSSSSSTASAAGNGCGGGKGMGSGGTVSGGINSPSDLFNKKVEDARKAVAQDKAEAAKRPPLIVETSSSPSAPSSPSPASSSSPSSSPSSSSSDSSSPSSPPSPSSSLKVSQTKPSPSAAAKTSPKSPTTSAAAAKTSAAAAAASSPVKVLKIKAKVPSEPPKTMYEFELKWRELKGSDADLAQYLKLFKVSTFKKVFKASTSPDIVPSLLRVAATQLSQNSSSSSRDLGACSRVLRGLAATAGFSMTRMLLSDDDKACVVQATDALSKSAKHAADAAEIRKAFL